GRRRKHLKFTVNTSKKMLMYTSRVGRYQGTSNLFKYIVLWLIFQNGCCQKKTLDEYCFSQLPGMINDLPGITSFLHLIRICSDIGIYNDCLLNRRATYSPDGEFKLPLYERYFPDDSSIEFAGYIFCAINFMTYSDRYLIGLDKMNDCQKKVDFPKCDKVIELDMPFLQSAIDKKEVEDVKSISCKMNYKHWKCIKEQFENCSTDTGPMFEYYLARLGDDCLIHHLEPNPIILTVHCTGGGEAGVENTGNQGTGAGDGGSGGGGAGKRNGGAGAQYRE
ncbi:unnamed protein product, partial [Lymnaea stagnalis]